MYAKIIAIFILLASCGPAFVPGEQYESSLAGLFLVCDNQVRNTGFDPIYRRWGYTDNGQLVYHQVANCWEA